VARSKKNDGRELADFCACYGSGCFARRSAPDGRAAFDYATYYALSLNVERVQRQQAVAVGRGLALALKPGDLPPGYAEALATEALPAEEVAFRLNADRQWDGALAKMGK
jgi:hypothetical protein